MGAHAPFPDRDGDGAFGGQAGLADLGGGEADQPGLADLGARGQQMRHRALGGQSDAPRQGFALAQFGGILGELVLHREVSRSQGAARAGIGRDRQRDRSGHDIESRAGHALGLGQVMGDGADGQTAGNTRENRDAALEDADQTPLDPLLRPTVAGDLYPVISGGVGKGDRGQRDCAGIFAPDGDGDHLAHHGAHVGDDEPQGIFGHDRPDKRGQKRDEQDDQQAQLYHGSASRGRIRP